MESVEKILQESGALLKGHFLLASGLHSPVYWEKFRILQSPDYTEQFCRMIVDHFQAKNIQVVIGPTTGGIILAFETARQLGVRGIFAEKDGVAKRTLRRGFNISRGERVLIVDDIITTGSSIREVLDVITSRGGVAIGIGVLVNRSEHGIEFGIPLFSCHQEVATTYQRQNCPLCKSQIPLIEPGSQHSPK
jgi:orotate phosphoribosyltransferase